VIKSALSNAQLHVLGFMYTHDCMAMFLTFARQGHYRNFTGEIEGEPTPSRDVLLALEKRGLVRCFTIARRECFDLTLAGLEYMMQTGEGEDPMNGRPLTKREIQAILLSHYAAFLLGKQQPHGFSIEIWQQKPRTDVKVCVNWRGIQFCEVGFASLNYKDTWDAEYGIKMAVHKAIAAIAKRIMYGLGPFARCEILVPPVPAIEEEEHVATNQS